MPKSFTQQNISQTYQTVIHANESLSNLPAGSQAELYDGVGNELSLKVGRNCDGVTVCGTLSASNFALGNPIGVVDIIYPVGSVYFSANSTNPGTLFPGTVWAARGQGRFIVGVGTGTDTNATTKTYSQGNGDGQYNVTLTVPPHRHGVGQFTAAVNNDFFFIKGDWDDGNSYTMRYSAGDGTGTIDQTKTGSPYGFKTSLPIESSGSATSQTTPPAYGLYIWERTS